MKNIKRKLRIVLCRVCIAAVWGTLPITAQAETYCDSLDYIIREDGAVITGYENSPVSLEIPKYIDGKEVVEIRENAFYKCVSLESVTIPDTLTKIGHHAFFGCSALKTAEIKGSVSVVEEGCFSGCSELQTATLGEKVKKIGKYAFYHCEGLRDIQLPCSVEEIGGYAFAGCGSLDSIQLPEKLVTVGECAFYSCDNMDSVYIPGSISAIGTFAFGYTGDSPVRRSGFVVTGEEYSLGESYAGENSFIYRECDDSEPEKTVPVLPVAVTLAAVVGLVFHRSLEKIKSFLQKYEYEC